MASRLLYTMLSFTADSIISFALLFGATLLSGEERAVLLCFMEADGKHDATTASVHEGLSCYSVPAGVPVMALKPKSRQSPRLRKKIPMWYSTWGYAKLLANYKPGLKASDWRVNIVHTVELPYGQFNLIDNTENPGEALQRDISEVLSAAATGEGKKGGHAQDSAEHQPTSMLMDELKKLDPAEEIPDSYFDQMLEERLCRTSTSTCPGGGSSVDWVARACNAYERVRTANQKGLAAEEKHAAFASKTESDNGNDNDISSDSSTDFGSLDSDEELDVAGVMAARMAIKASQETARASRSARRKLAEQQAKRVYQKRSESGLGDVSSADQIPRRGGVSPEIKVVGGFTHIPNLDSGGFFVVRAGQCNGACPNPAHSEGIYRHNPCRMNRSTNPGKAGAGRVGALIALWHQKAWETDREEHNSIAYKKKLGGAAYHAERLDLRLSLLSADHYALVRLHERPRGTDTSPEPTIVP